MVKQRVIFIDLYQAARYVAAITLLLVVFGWACERDLAEQASVTAAIRKVQR